MVWMFSMRQENVFCTRIFIVSGSDSDVNVIQFRYGKDMISKYGENESEESPWQHGERAWYGSPREGNESPYEGTVSQRSLRQENIKIPYGGNELTSSRSENRYQNRRQELEGSPRERPYQHGAKELERSSHREKTDSPYKENKKWYGERVLEGSSQLGLQYPEGLEDWEGSPRSDNPISYREYPSRGGKRSRYADMPLRSREQHSRGENPTESGDEPPVVGTMMAIRLRPIPGNEYYMKNKRQLIAELEATRQRRREIEARREDLVRKAKQLQSKTQSRRNQARDMWKKKYFEEKKKTPPYEDKCNRLRQELELLHRKIVGQMEGGKSRELFKVEKGENRPSEQSNLRIQATKLHHEIEELQRRVDDAKMKLTGEVKLRNQAEAELRALRAELTQKKINVTLTRSQKLAALGSSQDVYTAAIVSPRS